MLLAQIIRWQLAVHRSVYEGNWLLAAPGAGVEDFICSARLRSARLDPC